MPNQEFPVAFNQERASSYDTQYAKLAPLRDVLHLLTRLVFSDQPADARTLCVGAGTGSELIYLAQAFPEWQFTVLEPAAPMLEICRRRAEESGIAARCKFHEGYLDTLPDAPPFHAATSLLVSHFITQAEERRNFYRQIGTRLRPNGCLVSADLVSAKNTDPTLFDIWLRMQEYSDVSAMQIETMRASYGRDFAVQSAQEVANIIQSAGFTLPVLFLQTLMIHAWYAKRVASEPV